MSQNGRKVKLTVAAVNALAFAEPGRSYYVMDLEVPGFGVRVHERVMTYVLRYRRRPYVIGRARTLEGGKVFRLDEAREAARLKLVALWSGAPVEKRRERRPMTLLQQQYFKIHAPKKQKLSVDMDRVHWNKIIDSPLGRLAVEEVTTADVVAWHQGLAAVPVAANRALGVLAKALGLAEMWGWIPRGSNPARGIEKYPEHPKERHLSAAELERLGAAIAEARRKQSIHWQPLAIFELMALTGCRPKEIRDARKEQLDQGESCLHLDTAKGDRPGRRKGRVVWLSPEAMEVLLSLPSWKTDTPFLFPGRSLGPWTSLQEPWKALCEKAAIKDATPYCLRHTFVTQGGRAGVALEDVSDLAGHADITITNQVYRHGDVERQREAAGKMGSHMAGHLRRGKK